MEQLLLGFIGNEGEGNFQQDSWLIANKVV